MSPSIDITNLVENLRSSFVTWATAYIYGLEITVPGLEWVALPGLNIIDKAIITAILNLLTKSAVMEAFFLNTAVKKASQAEDYISAVVAKESLPLDASMEDYANAEAREISAFRTFVMLDS